jgi:hypothetical protein
MKGAVRRTGLPPARRTRIEPGVERRDSKIRARSARISDFDAFLTDVFDSGTEPRAYQAVDPMVSALRFGNRRSRLAEGHRLRRLRP